MNEMDLLAIIGKIDDDLIEAAAPTEVPVQTSTLRHIHRAKPQVVGKPTTSEGKPTAATAKKSIVWPRYATLAASVAVLLCGLSVYKTAIWGSNLATGSDGTAPIESAQSELPSTGSASQDDTDADQAGDIDNSEDYIVRGEEDAALVDSALAVQNAALLAEYTLQAPTTFTETAADGLLLLSPSITVGGMGFEGVILYDFSEYIDANPGWDCLDYGTLPVYFTEYSYYPDQYPEFMAQVLPVDTEALTARLRTLAACFGLDANTPITDNAPSQESIARLFAWYLEPYQSGEIAGIPNLYATQYEMQGDGITITLAYTNGYEEIVFEEGVSLQSSYPNTAYQTEVDRLTAIGEELIATYADYLDMQDPQVEITNLDYNIYGEQYLKIEIYEGAGEGEEALLNYQFNRVKFYINDADALVRIYCQRYDFSDKAGDYPILTLAQATAQLQSGNYITTVSEDDLLSGGLSNIAGVELVYRTGIFESSYMPYYRFWVEVEQGNDSAASLGLKNYGAYYVPAVQSEYLSEEMVWDGSFN
ncbi:MAG: hypothetical protein R3Y06_00155 [Faecalibacterium sp.]